MKFDTLCRTKAPLVCLLLLMSCVWSNCTSPQQEAQSVMNLGEKASSVFQRSQLFRWEQLFVWDLAVSDERKRWSVEAGSVGASTLGLRLEDAGESIRILREIEAPVDALDRLELITREAELESARLCWSQRRESFEPERCVGGVLHGESVVFRLPATARSAPVGRVRIDLSPSASAESPFRLLKVLGQRERVIGARLASAVSKGWLVTLRSKHYRETRSAWLAPPGVEIDVPLEVIPSGSVLRVAYGVEERFEGTLRFVVSARTRVGSAEIPLFDRSVTGLSPSGWQEAEIALESLAGQSIDLVFKTVTDGVGGEASMESGLAFWARPQMLSSESATDRRRNVLLISVDTLRPDHLSFYGYGRQTSPHLEAWAESCGSIFENAVAQSPWTIPSHASMLTGLDAMSHGVNHVSRLPDSLTTLAEKMSTNGYVTAAFTGGGYVSEKMGFEQGFDQFNAWRRSTSAEEELKSGVARATRWLENHTKTPFFLFFHTYEVHSPYRPREPYYSDFRGAASKTSELPVAETTRRPRLEEGFLVQRKWVWLEDPQKRHDGSLVKHSQRGMVVDRYDSGIAYMDVEVSTLIRKLRTLGLADDTIVVLTSDHGESLGEKNLMGHTHLYDTNVLVPLVIARPGCHLGARRIEHQVRSVDIVPTILDLVDTGPEPRLDGVSLVPLLEGRRPTSSLSAWSYAPFSNRGIALRVDRRLKYILNNSAWDSARGKEEILRLPETLEAEADGRVESDQIVDSRLLVELREQARRRLDSVPGGVRLRFSNTSPEPVRIRLADEQIRTRIKSLKLPDGRLLAASDDVEVKVEAGDDFFLVVENPISLEISPSLPPGKTVRLDLSVLQDGWRLRLMGRSWKEEGFTEGLERYTGVEANWTRRPESGDTFGDDPTLQDPELREQLRALGYID